MGIGKEQIAHDLAIAYVNNRHGAEVSGDFEVSTYDGNAAGSGSVRTFRLPATGEIHKINVPTGEKHFFGLLDVTESIPAGYEVDTPFRQMISDYFNAYERFLELLENR